MTDETSRAEAEYRVPDWKIEAVDDVVAKLLGDLITRMLERMAVVADDPEEVNMIILSRAVPSLVFGLGGLVGGMVVLRQPVPPELVRRISEQLHRKITEGMALGIDTAFDEVIARDTAAGIEDALLVLQAEFRRAIR